MMCGAAAERIRPLARKTPVMTSSGFDSEAGTRTFFKCENLQRGGAFKIRGAANLILSLPPDALARGIVAYSSGNHAQATAIAAQHVGARATIVMPEDAPRSKMEATRARGARIVTYNRFTENRESIAGALLKEGGATLVPPFDHPMIMAGQGTAALELLAESGPPGRTYHTRRWRWTALRLRHHRQVAPPGYPHFRGGTGRRQRHVPLHGGRRACGGAAP